MCTPVGMRDGMVIHSGGYEGWEIIHPGGYSPPWGMYPGILVGIVLPGICTLPTLVGIHLPVYVLPSHPWGIPRSSCRSRSYSAVSTPWAVAG